MVANGGANWIGKRSFAGGCSSMFGLSTLFPCVLVGTLLIVSFLIMLIEVMAQLSKEAINSGCHLYFSLVASVCVISIIVNTLGPAIFVLIERFPLVC